MKIHSTEDCTSMEIVYTAGNDELVFMLSIILYMKKACSWPHLANYFHVHIFVLTADLINSLIFVPLAHFQKNIHNKITISLLFFDYLPQIMLFFIDFYWMSFYNYIIVLSRMRFVGLVTTFKIWETFYSFF